MGIRTCVCVRARDDGSPGNHLRPSEHYQMSWWGKERGKEKARRGDIRVSQRQKENRCYTFWHRPDPIQTPTQGMLAVSFFLEKNPLTGYPAAAKTHHLNSVTHLLRSAVTCLQTRRALSVYLRVINHQLCNFLRKAHRGIYALRSNSWRDDTNPPMRHQK